MTVVNRAYLEDHLRRMQHEIEITTRRLELEKRRLNKLDEELHRHRLEYEDKTMPKKTPRAPMTSRSQRLYTPRAQTRPTPVTNRDVKKIENRLSKSLAKLNALKHENHSMRNRMDQLRRERLQMNHVFKKLQDDVKECNAQMKQIEADTESAREMKNDAARQIEVLKKKLAQQRREYKEGVARLKQNMEASEHERRRQCLADTRARKKRNNFLITDEECAFSDVAFMKRITKLAFLNCIQRRHIKQHQKNIEVFEQAFSTIKSTTGISDIEEIVKIFVKLEERNFSLLTYVNELNRNVDQMEARNKELGLQIQCMKESDGVVEQRRTQTLQSIRQQIAATTEMTMEDVSETKMHSDIVTKCFPTIETILRMIQDENESLGADNAAAPSVDSESMCDLLHCVEQMIAQWKDFLPESRDKSGWKAFPSTVVAQVKTLVPKRAQFGPPLLRATDLPTTTDKDDNKRRLKEEPDDSDSDGDHVWTRQELKEKTLASLIKRRKMKKLGGDHVDKDDDLGDREMGYEDMIERKRDNSLEPDAESGDDIGPTDAEIREIFLKRYKMTKEELQAVADQKGIHLNNLCYLKQEFDQYDADRSGFIDVTELRDLLSKLGEEFDEEDLQAAFTDLDSDRSGEIEFFEFVDWFTSDS